MVQRHKFNQDSLDSLVLNKCVLTCETQLLDLPMPGLLAEPETKSYTIQTRHAPYTPAPYTLHPHPLKPPPMKVTTHLDFPVT